MRVTAMAILLALAGTSNKSRDGIHQQTKQVFVDLRRMQGHNIHDLLLDATEVVVVSTTVDNEIVVEAHGAVLGEGTVTQLL